MSMIRLIQRVRDVRYFGLRSLWDSGYIAW